MYTIFFDKNRRMLQVEKKDLQDAIERLTKKGYKINSVQ